ncbi:hypothetical protein PEX1_032860 [Penicillium expansum]|nr:hypothetical protein PEX1_032860 [Penicillium expansum]
MATAVPATETDELAASIENLMVEPEILISLRDRDLMGCSTTSEAAAISVSLDALAGFHSNGVFVFKDPQALEAYFSNTSSTRATATKLRLVPMHQCITNPILRMHIATKMAEEINARLTLPPVNRPSPQYPIEPKGYEFVELVNDWRAACRAAPNEHEVEEIIFDLSGASRLCPSYISRLLQNMSTVLAVKAGGPFHSRLRDDESYQYQENVVKGLASNRLYVELMQVEMQQEMIQFLSTLTTIGMGVFFPGI